MSLRRVILFGLMNETDWQASLDAGIRAIRQSNPRLAREKLEAAHRLAPQDRDVRFWLANALRLTGDARRSEALFRRLLAEKPRDEESAFALAFLLRELGRPRDSARVVTDFTANAGTGFDSLMKAAGFLRDGNQYDAAIAVCRQALALQPGRADLFSRLARLHQAIGDFEQALACSRRALGQDPRLGGAWLSLAQLQRFETGREQDFALLEQASGDDLGTEANMCAAFALGKALDDIGRWPEAWRQYEKGNRLHRAEQPWDRQAMHDFADGALEQSAAAAADAPGDGRKPVFIVGMLRSGTTLLEQRLDRHPGITGRGELNFLARIAAESPVAARMAPRRRSELADMLWTHMRLDGTESAYYIDKNPLNFRFLAHVFTIFPSARVIHVHRDGRDSCLSCYFQLFQHSDAGFSDSLEDLADYYGCYRRLMAHWAQAFGARIHQVSYEELVADTRGSVAAVLGFLGAGGDAQAPDSVEKDRVVRTASAWQARQPVYTRSLGRWENYYDQAPDFFDRIKAIDDRYGDT